MKLTKAKIPLIFILLLLLSSGVIYFGKKSDAVTMAKNLKSGVLTADTLNLAFENVGGKVIKQYVIESQWVEKGDILMQLDDQDLNITQAKMAAMIDAQKASIRQQQALIEIERSELELLQFTTWRKIEEIQAMLDSALATEKRVKRDYDRSLKLSQKGTISQSEFDSAANELSSAQMLVIQLKSQLKSLTMGADEAELTRLTTEKSAEGMTLISVKNSKEKVNNLLNQLDLLKAQLAQYEAEYTQIELNLKRLTLTAPERGKVLKVLYEEGELIAPNAPAVILESDRKYVDIYVNEEQVMSYQPGVDVQVELPALKSQISGKVRFANMAPSFSDLRSSREHGQSDLTSYQVRIYFPEADSLLTGMTVEVEHE